MAYKDILVFLDPTAEAVERARFAAGLAKSHGARLIAVDISKQANAEGIDPGSVTRRMFAEFDEGRRNLRHLRAGGKA